MVAVCEMTGWTYYEYLNQPKWFVRLLLDKLEIDASESRKKTKK